MLEENEDAKRERQDAEKMDKNSIMERETMLQLRSTR